MSGDSGGRTTTQSTVSAQQEPFVDILFAESLNAFQDAQGQTLPSTRVSPNANIEQGFQGTLDFARTGAQDISGQAQQGFSDLLGTLDPSSSPIVQNQISTANQAIADDFNRLILPSISDDAIATGQFGGSRQGVAEGLAAEGAADAIAASTSNILSDAFRTGSQNAQFALGNTGNLFNIANMPSFLQGQVGQSQAAFEQSAIDDRLAQFLFNINRPFDVLSNFQGLVTGNFGNQSVTQ